MLVILISECEKRAFTRSRRILNKYLFQMGRRTWMGRITEEGLAELRGELKQAASRHMAVACHRVVGRSRTELAWIVGSRRHFARTGEFAFAWTRQDALREVREKTPMERLLHHLTELVGLAHDLGKMTAGFQDKLARAQVLRDPFRHEVVSAVLLLRLAGAEAPRFREVPQNWLDCLACRNTVEEGLEAIRDGGVAPADGVPNFLKEAPATLPFLKRTRLPRLLRSLLWLVLSHHRLPDGKAAEEADGIQIWNGAHVRGGGEEETAPFLRVADRTPFWEDGPWTEAFAERAARLGSLLRDHPRLSEVFVEEGEAASHFAFLLQGYARPGLLLGDQAVSKEDQRETSLAPEAMHANTGPEGNLARPLGDHMQRVGHRAGSFLRLAYRGRSAFPVVSPDAYPEMLRREPAAGAGPEHYRWQEDARAKIRARHGDGIREGGGFYLLMAGTGTGKTRAVPKLLAELSADGLRYSLGLGLRTLTLQSGAAYREEVGFSEAQVATLVGSRLAQELHALSRREEAAGGSDSFLDYDEELAGMLVDAEEDLDAELPGGLEAFLRGDPKRRKLLKTPVTVSTVDHLVGPVTDARTRFAPISFRLLSSDLVLDEIDQYDEADLVSIGKLVHLAGLYGNKVILSSATIPPAVAARFYQAYRKGFAAFQRLREEERPLFAGWIGDCAEYTEVRSIEAETDFTDLHAQWTERVVAGLEEAAPRRRAEVLLVGEVLSGQEGLDSAYKAIFSQAVELHRRHHEVDAETGKRLSVGMVRWGNTPPCRDFARYLVEGAEEGTVEHKVLCYHAGLIPAVRYEVEYRLDGLLSRKPGDPPLAEKPLMRSLLASSPASDLMLVVVTSPIEDTGRDHDFDWAIVEPNTTRAVIQSAGRVLRHREGFPDTPNVALMERPWRALVEGEGRAYRWPGAESAVSGDPGKPAPEFQLAGARFGLEDPTAAAQVLPMARFEAAIDGAPTIRETEEAPLQTLEHEHLHWFLGPREMPSEATLADYLGADKWSLHLRLTNRPMRAMPFRDGDAKAVFFREEPNGPWKRWDDNEERALDSDGQIHDEPLDDPEGRLLSFLPRDREAEEALVTNLAQRLWRTRAPWAYRLLTELEVVVYNRTNQGNDLHLRYHPALGAVRHRKRFPFRVPLPI